MTKKVTLVRDFVLNNEIFGVFSSKEKAEEVVRKYCEDPYAAGSSFNDFTFKEFDLDEIVKEYANL